MVAVRNKDFRKLWNLAFFFIPTKKAQKKSRKFLKTGRKKSTRGKGNEEPNYFNFLGRSINVKPKIYQLTEKEDQQNLLEKATVEKNLLVLYFANVFLGKFFNVSLSLTTQKLIFQSKLAGRL